MSDTEFNEEYPEPFERCISRFQDQLTSTRCGNLRKNGYVVIDNFLGRSWALALLQEMKWLHRKG